MRWSERVAPRSLRSRLTLVMAAAGVVLTIALIGGFNVVLTSGLDRDAEAAVRARASAARASVGARGDKLFVREAPDDRAIDRQVWVFSGDRVVEAPPEPARAQSAAAALARAPHGYRDVSALDLRLYALPVRSGARRLGAVVAGVSLAPYEHSASRALVASLVLGAVVLASVLIAVRLAIAAALRPVDRMTAEAATWSFEDLDHRFADAGEQDELGRLAATFNDLLARLAASFRHEQRFSAEVSHELRTPLAKLIAETDLALRRERTTDEYRTALGAVGRDAREMERVIDTLLAVARSQIDPRSGTADATDVVASVAASLHRGEGERVALEIAGAPSGLRLGVDEDLAERVLAPVVSNALRYADARASLELRARDSVVEIRVSDDGPGVPAEQREAIFTPGFRGAPPGADPERSGGAGLGLALARRLARAAGGDVDCEDGPGTVFVVSLPSA